MIKSSILRKCSAILALSLAWAVLLPLKACAKEMTPVEEPIGIITMTTKVSEVAFYMAGTGDISIDWGDGKVSNLNDAIFDELSKWFWFGHDYSGGTAYNIVITGNVTMLICSGLGLTALDVSRNTALTDLNCGNNQLTALDVSRNPALERLRCESNQIRSLNVNKNDELYLIVCGDNPLTISALNDLFRTLPDRTKKDWGTVYLVRNSPEYLDCDRSIAEKKKWGVQSLK